MPIQLQCSVGGFDPEFLALLPALEKAMLANGMEPSDFIIAKDRTDFPDLPVFIRPGGNPFAYTVFVKDQSFTVTERSDLSFYRYLYSLCSASGAEAPVRPGLLLSVLRKVHGRVGNFVQWLNAPAFKPPL
jgi:hypothetical protein